MTEQELYNKVLKKFGWQKQLIKAQEEAAEFIQAISKYLLSGSYEDVLRVIEEGTDNEIMTNQIKSIFPYKELWAKYKKAKLDRVSKLLE
jgi:hypothetical protein